MISLLPLSRVLSYTAVVYALLVSIVTLIAQTCFDASALRTLPIAISGAGVLQGMLFWLLYIGWRPLWRQFPRLNRLLYPDIEGVWSMQIHWQGAGDESGSVEAEAVVKQDLIRLSMEVRSPGSDSQTLVAQPKRDPESGRPLLYYTYLVHPRSTASGAADPYYGSAVLRYSSQGDGELIGSYWTSRLMRGQFTLSKKQHVT